MPPPRPRLISDQDDVWLTGGLESDVIAEARLDPDAIFAGVQRFAQERPGSARCWMPLG